VGLFTLAPYSFQLVGQIQVHEQIQGRFQDLSEFGRITAWDLWTNALLFVPFGFLLLGLPPVAVRSPWAKVLFAGLVSALVSASLEAAQAFLPRHPSINDVACNTLGGIAGVSLAMILGRYPRVQSFRYRGTDRTKSVVLVLYFASVLAVFAVPLPLAEDLDVWESEIEVILGGEDQEREGWQGAIYLVSVYERELTPHEVFTNYLAGPFLNPGTHRVAKGQALLYPFSIVNGNDLSDMSTRQLPVRLWVKDPTRARWLKPHGLGVFGTSLTMSSSPPLRPTGWRAFIHQEFSLETWIAPADQADFGRARIVSYSRNPPRRKLTFSQYRREFSLRLGPSDPSVLKLSQTTDWGAEPQIAQHVVITYRDGIVSSYHNSVKSLSSHLRVNHTMLDALLESIGEQFRWAVCSLLIFPLGIGCVLWNVSRYPSMPGRWRALLMASFLLFLLVLARQLSVNVVEPSLVACGVATMLASIMVAPSLIRYIENI